MPAGIRPSDINAQTWIRGAFATEDMNRAATWVVRFCQARGGNDWRSFSLAEIDQFHSERTGGRLFDFGGLSVGGLVEGGGKGFVPTAEFIQRCHRASPA